jgi:hypothetical protein
MRRLLLSYAFPVLLLICLSQCKRDVYSGQVLTGKLVVASGCGNPTIQLTNGQLPPGRIADSWKDPVTNIVYAHVFTVSNSCEFAQFHLVTGDSISFQLKDGPLPLEGCMECFWYYPTPSAMNMVINAKKLN